MTSFTALSHYSSFLVFLVGLITAIATLGFGLLLLEALGLKFPTPWRQVTAILLGLLTVSLGVQLLGFTGLAYSWVLISLWGGLLMVGSAKMLRGYRDLMPPGMQLTRSWQLLPLIICGAALLINLMVAIAPSTKIDELYYHMVIPSRILLDHALLFYREPWEGAVYAHGIYQMSLTPLYALGVPDAGNVVSWFLSLTLVWFCAYLLAIARLPSVWIFIASATVIVGLYPTVWHVTGGAHAMGDLAIAAATLALLLHRSLLRKMGGKDYVTLVSILSLAGVATKVSLLPLGGTMVLLAIIVAILSMEKTPPLGSILGLVLRAIIPWLILYAPILLWTFFQSGSPFGPMLSHVFSPWSIYEGEPIPIQQVLKETKASLSATASVLSSLSHGLPNYSPLLGIGIVALFFNQRIFWGDRLLALGLLLVQTLVILVFLFADFRFYSGLPYGLFIFSVLGYGSPTDVMIKTKKQEKTKFLLCPYPPSLVIWLTSLCFLPWLILQLYYSLQFMPVVLGQQKPLDFATEKVALIEDYQRLDTLLPTQAHLYIDGPRVSLAYAPRPVYRSLQDLPNPGEAYLLTTLADPPTDLPGFTLGELIYDNPQAITTVYRTPNRSPARGPVRVWQLYPKQETEPHPHRFGSREKRTMAGFQPN
ncbi:hypothetical protein L3556_13200 [Candidatus Synechococcus calcipolaris G9]|uniref:Glycosyltransferase RgtA/B/C/D-like domain-containing protein n=1 Tax=Candidatus Synechococcus calcipolaris G9 TaxID=1497997 RepID=A0ABT6F214_9SYNE|nr:hypothetical protein [Candidatus Synechococcus calcipolaris]MDG2991879.1 hypothetical protein [Candidatus Synechococcus calcipolaris G9]